MYRVNKNNVVAIPRGESFVIPVEIVYKNFPEMYKINLEENDRVYFGVVEVNNPFSDALIKKEFTMEDINEDGFINILIKPEDTLCIQPGTYYWTVKALYELDPGDVRITTIIDRAKFIITE